LGLAIRFGNREAIFLAFHWGAPDYGPFTLYETHKTIKGTNTAALLAGNAAWDGIPARS
jgi:hypothetical protein